MTLRRLVTLVALSTAACGMPAIRYVATPGDQPAARVALDVTLLVPPTLHEQIYVGHTRSGILSSYSVPFGRLLLEASEHTARTAFRSVTVVATGAAPSATSAFTLVPRWGTFESEGGGTTLGSRSRSSLELSWVLLGPLADTIAVVKVDPSVEGAHGPSGGKKQTATRIQRLFQELHARSVRALIADSAVRGAAAWGPFASAIAGGRLAAVDSALARGADANWARGSRTALMYAAEAAQPAVVARLLAAGARPDALGEGGITTLMRAAAGGDSAVTAMLLAAGAQPNAQNARGGTALMEAAHHGRTAIVPHLLAAGADPRVVAEGGATASILAWLQGHRELARTLARAAGEPEDDPTLIARYSPAEAAAQVAAWLTPLTVGDLRKPVSEQARIAGAAAFGSLAFFPGDTTPLLIVQMTRRDQVEQSFTFYDVRAPTAADPVGFSRVIVHQGPEPQVLRREPEGWVARRTYRDPTIAAVESELRAARR